MPFNPLPKREFVAYTKTLYMDLTPGKHTVRILSDSPYIVDVHNIRKGYVKCLGADCPVCKKNKEIIFRSPENYRANSAYSGRTTRIYVNLLDLTPVKVCPNPECQSAVKKNSRAFPDACPKCGTFIKKTETHPLNKVVVLNMGKTLYDQFVSIDGAIKTPEGDPMGLNNFDIIMTVVGAGTSRTITAEETDPIDNVVREVPADSLFDLSKSVLTLPADKIEEYRKGADLRSIFASMRGVSTENSDLEDDAEDSASDLEDLFKPKDLE